MNKDLLESSALLTIQEAAGILGVSTKSLRRWDKAGILVPQRTSGNQRRYTKDQINGFKKKREMPYGFPSALNSSNLSSSTSPGGQVEGVPLDHLEGVPIARHSGDTAQRATPESPLVEGIRNSGLARMRLRTPNFVKVSIFAFSLCLLLGVLTLTLFEKMGRGELVLAVKEYLIGSSPSPSPIGRGAGVREGVRDIGFASGEVLQASTIDNRLFFHVNIPSKFAQNSEFLKGLSALEIATLSGGIITDNSDIDAGTGTLTASNVLYGVVAGTGISLGTGQTPTIKNTDLGSSQNIFKTIKVGSDSFSAGSNTDTLEFASGTGISLSTDKSNKKVTITGSATSGWTDDGTAVRLTTSTDSVGIGLTSPSSKLDVLATSEQLRLLYDTSNYTSFTISSSGDLTLNPTGGDIIFSDADVLNIGGSGSDTAYNIIGDSSSGASSIVDSDDDLYIEGSIEAEGTVRFNNVSYTFPSADGSSNYLLSTDGSGSLSWQSVAGVGATNFWRISSGGLSPVNDTLDVLIGNTATTSAKFGFLNVNSGTPTATISANSGNNAAFLTGLGVLATANSQTLTLGGSSTGNIILQPLNGSGTVGIGTTSPSTSNRLHVEGQCVTGDTLLKRRRRRKKRQLADVLGGVGDRDRDQQKTRFSASSLTSKHTDVVVPDPSGSNITGRYDLVKRDVDLRGVEPLLPDLTDQVPHRRKPTSLSSITADNGEWEHYWENVRIDQIQAGDEILTLDEITGEFVPQRVRKLMAMGKKEIYKLTTASGKTIRTTAEHPYLTLADDKQAFAFIDEAGVAKAPDQPVFGLAVFYIHDSLTINRKLHDIFTGAVSAYQTNESRFEFKFNAVTRNNLRFYQAMIEALAKDDSWSFAAVLTKKEKEWNYWDSYLEILPKLINKAPFARLTIVADYLAKPQTSKKDLETITKMDKVAHLLQLESQGSLLLQAADVLLGALHFEERQKELGLTSGKEAKIKLAKLVKTLLAQKITAIECLHAVKDNLSQAIPAVKRQRWTKVKDLARGTFIATVDGWEKITKIERLRSEDVFDIEVENTHNFIGNNIVAHNTYISGNLGIGDTSPDSLLDILSATTGSDIIITNINATDTDVTVGFALVDGTNNFTLGVDDSVTGDPFKISTTALGTGDTLTIDSSTTTSGTSAVTLAGIAPTIASAAGAEYTTLTVTPPTITLTGTTGVTSAMDSILINAPTITDTSAVTVTTASTLTIAAAPTAGGSVTITNPYALFVDAGNVRFDGRLGVGTAPATTIGDGTGGYLTVAASIAGDTAGIRLQGGNGIDFHCIDTSNCGFFSEANWAFVLDYPSANDAAYFQIENQSLTAIFRVMEAGNVGIGDTTPDVLLDILSATTGSDIIITNINATDTDVTVGFALVDGTNNFTLGVDDSVTGDPFKISTTALGTSDMLTLDSTTTGAATVAEFTLAGLATTVSDSASAEYTTLTITPPTITLGGATTVTSQMDSILFSAPTITRSAATTVDDAATLTINGPPIEAGSVTLTDAYGLMINAGTTTPATRAYGLYVNPPTGAGTNYAAVFASGNVGIGTATPAYLLDVVSPSSTHAIRVQGTTGGPGSATLILDRGDTSRQAGIEFHTASSRIVSLGLPNTSTDNFYIANSDWSPVYMTIDTGGAGVGNVGIGDTTPDVLLDILSATTGSDIIITNINATDTDVTVGFALVDGTNNFTLGVDDSVTGDPFKISTTALGTSDMLTIDSQTTTSGVSTFTLAGIAPTIASAAGAEYTSLTVTPPTITLTGTTGVTSQMDSILVNAPTITDSSAVTVDDAATLTINGPPIEAGSVTLTDAYGLMINAGTTTPATRAYGLYVNPPTGAGTNYAAVFASGNVGIGTATPTERLDVEGGHITDVNDIIFDGGPTDALSFLNSPNEASWQMSIIDSTDGNSARVFNAIDGGNIGINTTTPNAKFEVSNAEMTSTQPIVYISNETGTDTLDPLIQYRLGSTPSVVWTMGVDDSDNDTFKIGTTAITTGNVLTLDSRTTTSGVSVFTLAGIAPTIASAAGAEYTTLTVTPPTITLTGTTQVTSAMDSILFNAPTITDASAVTVDDAATLRIAAAPTAGGSVTITRPYSLWVDAGNARFDGRTMVGGLTAPTGKTGDTAWLSVAGSSGGSTNGIAFASGNGYELYGMGSVSVGSNGSVVFDIDDNADSTTDSILVRTNGAATTVFQVFENGDLRQGDGTTTTSRTANFFFLNTSAGAPTGAVTNITGTSAMTYDDTNNKLCLRDGTAWLCSAALTDIAEWVPAPGTEGGDLVAVTSEPNPVDDPTAPTLFGKTTKAYDPQMVGIISQYAEEVQSAQGYKLSEDYHAMTLVGRVPVKVSLENGPILAGDYLTSSSTPGVAMKATKAGRVIGIALEAFDQTDEDGKILVFVNPHWSIGTFEIAADGNLIQNTQNTQSIGSSESQSSGISDSLTSPTASDSPSFQSFLKEDPLFKDLSEKVSLLEAKIDSLSETASSSALIKEIEDVGEIGAVWDIAEIKTATISGSLMVLGKATVSDLGITGNISAGVLAINGLEGKVDTLAGDLKLQSEGLGGIDILNGKITIDTKGNLNVGGTITAKKINIDESDIGSKSIGESLIEKGQTSITVNTEAITEKSKVFVTATTLTGGNELYVSESSPSAYFKVSIETKHSKDIKFNWWVVN